MGGLSVVLEAEQEKAVWINFGVCICFRLSEGVLVYLFSLLTRGATK